MTTRCKIALDIYCAIIKTGTVPDLEATIRQADEFISAMKENAGFFVDIEKYNKAVDALHKLNSNELQPSGFIEETLLSLGEL